MNAVELSLFAHRLAAICDEMGAVLKRTALSPNIKDREDYSCALFDRVGELVAQAAHIPVHLGSMAYAMRNVVKHMDWQRGDAVVFNDPFLGGTHLPDITVVIPVFIEPLAKLMSGNRLPHFGPFPSWNFGPWNHHAPHSTPKMDSKWDCRSS
ncbi:MAG: hydantoinase B/oxoprolinase family protein, partial [Mariprofundaceae bacterium]|nr:hydantoinase B/oxoprolinase family protein [Mariprofundaceae bacterium]